MQIAQWGWCYNVLYLCSALVVFKIFKHIAPSQLLIRQPLASHFFVLATSKHVYCHCLINHSFRSTLWFCRIREYQVLRETHHMIPSMHKSTLSSGCSNHSNPDLDETLPCSHVFLLAQRNHWFLGLAKVLFGPVKHGSSCGAAIVAWGNRGLRLHPLLRSGRKCWSPLASATKGTPKVDPKRNSCHHDYIIVS